RIACHSCVTTRFCLPSALPCPAKRVVVPCHWHSFAAHAFCALTTVCEFSFKIKMNTNGFGTNILVLDNKNWDRWSALMKSLFGAQETLEVVTDGYEELVANPSDAQRSAYKEAKKKDCKALFYIQQNVDSFHFEKIAKATKSKEA
ncbi:F-box protein, partial [Trifolium medium]|nr:F-box protein [Trifolium medium]